MRVPAPRTDGCGQVSMCFAAPVWPMVIYGLHTVNRGVFVLDAVANAHAAGICCAKRWQQCIKLMTNASLGCVHSAAPVQTGAKL